MNHRVGDPCPECGQELVEVEVSALRRIRERLRPRFRSLPPGAFRRKSGHCTICRDCDADALGIHTTELTPFRDKEGNLLTVDGSVLEAAEPPWPEFEALDASPLFHLSLASKELFHSNFIAFLCQRFPQEMSGVFSDLLGQRKQIPVDTNGRGKGIWRERGNLDLDIGFADDSSLVIEVKVKSLPREDQLQEYASKVAGRKTCDLWLLSLAQASFSTGHGSERPSVAGNGCAQVRSWRHVDLVELVEDVQKRVRPADAYLASMIQDYGRLVLTLGEVRSRLIVDFEDDASFFLPDPVVRKLTAHRIHDWAFKLRYGQLAQKVWESFGLTRLEGRWTGKEGTTFASSGMSRGTGLCSVGRVILGSGTQSLFVGVQFQGHMLRLFSRAETSKQDAAQKVFTYLAGGDDASTARRWFHIEGLPARHRALLRPANMRDDFCQYDKLFYYNYWLVRPDATARDLADLMGSLVRSIENWEESAKPALAEILGWS